MSYRNPQQVVDTQTGQHYRNLQKSLSSTFAGVAQSYKAEQDKLEKEQKAREAKNNAIVDFNQKQEDAMMSSVAKLKAQNPTLDTSAIYDMVDRYSDIKNAIDLGTITDKAELRKMREQLAQIKSIPDGLNTSLVGFGALSEDFTEYIAKAGKKGGLDLKSADPTLLSHLNVFLNKRKGERKFETQFDENGNMRTGIFLKSSEEGDKGKFYTKDELVSYMDGVTGGLPRIPDDTKASEELVSNVFGVDPITKKITKPMPGIVDKIDVRQRDGSIKVEERINEEKLKEKLKPIALANVSSWGNAGIVSYYNNMLKPGELLEDEYGKEIKVLTTENLDENTKKKIADLYVNKFIKDKGILNYGKTLETDTTTKRPNIYSDSNNKPNQTQTTDYDDVTSVAKNIKSGNYQDVNFPGTVISIEKSNATAEKGKNMVSVELEVGSKREFEEFDLNSKTELYSLAEKIFKGSSKEIRDKRSEFVKQMLSKNKASASDNKETDIFGNPI